MLEPILGNGTAEKVMLYTLVHREAYARELAPLAGALLQKDVRHAASLADGVSAPKGTVFDAADTALNSMEHPR